MFRAPIAQLMQSVFGRTATLTRKADGTTVTFKCHIRGLKTEEIIGGYRESDLFMVIPAGAVNDSGPMKFDQVTTDAGEAFVVMADFRRAYGARGELVSFKGYIRGQP